MIAITIDMEWSPEHVLFDTLELLDEYSISATLFSTHDDSLTTSHERALHPNFFDDPEGKALDELNELYPYARGLRSHGMYVHSRLRNLYPEYGIEYESNYMEYRVSDLKPFWMPEGTLQFPVYWMDDPWLHLRESSLPSVAELLSGDGLKLFDFHPVHICYNTPSTDYYEANKDAYWDDTATVDRLRANETGVRDVFVTLLEYIDEHGLQTETLGALAERHMREQPFEEMTA